MARLISLPWLVLKRTVLKFFEDNGLFLASGLAFDLLLFCIPFSLLVVSAMGYALGSPERALDMLQAVLQELVPKTREAFTSNLSMIIENRGLLGLVGFSLFFLTSSLTFGSVRAVLDIVFRIRNSASFFKGKAWDVVAMLVTSGLLTLMVALASLLSVADSVLERFPRVESLIGPGWVLAGDILGFLFTLTLFFLLYKFCPSRKCLRRTSVFVASFTGAALFELSKWIFAYYMDTAGGTVALYGALGGLFFFLMWIYYACATLIVGAEAGWVFQQTLYPPEEERTAV